MRPAASWGNCVAELLVLRCSRAMLAREIYVHTSSWVTASSGSTGTMSSMVIARGGDLSPCLSREKK